LCLQDACRVGTDGDTKGIDQNIFLSKKSWISYKANRRLVARRIGTRTNGRIGIQLLAMTLVAEHGGLLLEPHGLDEKTPKNGVDFCPDNAALGNSKRRRVGKGVGSV
jgi:hypothetical protein